ncbi:hypothetical protein BJ138DRAFT_1107647 [Hygrophoropsis aurantiaca]|uniref:Uncharacterized protein n=1 Tax=Hygrophoropsis aurantiaca TaxID=72124 RepID=A0ACB7ZRD5_9AGAM|nr:hypothetical protein BJ138DRAFT_1107647 [Hygrophoropsis aurantiaca]
MFVLLQVLVLATRLLSYPGLFPDKKNHDDILAHCKRELVHAVWCLLLNNEFLEAYKNGVVIKCHDGIDRLVQTFMQTMVAAARNAIYRLRSPVKGSAVEALLKEFSLVPTAMPNFFSFCAILTFEGFFPVPHDNIIRTLLFQLAEWHALAKLRLHTDESLELLDNSLKALATQLRKFQRLTCAAFETKELPSKTMARQRQQKHNTVSNNSTGSRRKVFNLLTYKFHALGDYTVAIKKFGTTNSYTTQIHGEEESLEHDPDSIPSESRYSMAQHTANMLNLPKLLSDNWDDPTDFIPKLRNHLLNRLYDYSYNGDKQEFSEAEHNNLEDAPDAHPYWYAQILQAFRIPVRHTSPGTNDLSLRTMDVLWPEYDWGFKDAHLPKVGFVEDADENTFGFLDPSLVIRACHLVPAFAAGRTTELLRGDSLTEISGRTTELLRGDMYCHFAGIGVGHATQFSNPKLAAMAKAPRGFEAGCDEPEDSTNSDYTGSELALDDPEAEDDGKDQGKEIGSQSDSGDDDDDVGTNDEDCFSF